MKHATKTSALTTLPFIVSSLIVYLFGSFGSASWNPVEWTVGARWVCITWAFAWGFALWARIESGRLQ